MRANSFLLSLVFSATYLLLALILYFPHATTALGAGGGGRRSGGLVPVSDGPTVRKDERWPLVSSEFGEISAVKISDGRNGSYHLHFITMDPQSLFLPVHLYSEMIFYVNSGSGTLNWMDINEDDDKLQQVNLQSGDVYRLQPGTVFYLENNLVADIPRTLQIYAIFSDSEDKLQQNEQLAGVYAGLHDLVLGFDNIVLESALNVSEEVIDELRAGESQSLIVQALPEICDPIREVGFRVINAYLGIRNNDIFNIENKKKDKNKKDKNKKKAYNIREADPDVENCYGWSTTVTKKQLKVLKDTDFSVFMVNLNKGAMMGPHWNPRSAEIAIVLRGQGMVEVVCPAIAKETVCKNSRFRVAEGDVFVVPRYHPMAQISFDNESFVFMGFTMTTKDSLPQYLAGKLSILQKLGEPVLAKSFNVSNTTMDQVLSAQKESFILDCTACAEDEERVMEEEARREGKGRREGGGGGRQGAERGGDIARMGERKEAWRGRERRGGGGGWQEAERGGEIARREEEKEARRERVGGGGGAGGWREEKEVAEVVVATRYDDWE